jgi:hypothetical protein
MSATAGLPSPQHGETKDATGSENGLLPAPSSNVLISSPSDCAATPNPLDKCAFTPFKGLIKHLQDFESAVSRN